MQSSDELKRKLKIWTFSQNGDAYILNNKGRTPTSSRGQEIVNVYDKIGPNFQVILNESEIVW